VRRPPVRWLLTAWFGVSVLAIVTPFALALLWLQWRASVDALDHHLEEDLAVAAQLLRHEPDGAVDWAVAGDVDPGYDAGPQRWVEAFDLDGTLLFARGVARRPGVQMALPPARASDPAFASGRTPAGARIRLHVATREVDGAPYLLRVARTEDDIRADWRHLVRLFLLSIPIAVLLAAGVGYALAGRALAPLARITDRARAISAEQLSARLPVENPHDELGELAIVFNQTFERLEGAFDRLRRFTADASHELRTPLTAIRSVGEVGLREARSPETYREIIGSMLEEADRLTRLVNSLLLLSRWEAGRSPAHRAPVELATIAADVVEQLGVLAEEKSIALRIVADGAAVVDGDASMLRQAVMNVLDNAIKYSPPGGVIDVGSRGSAESCELHIADYGPGIPSAELPRIFDRFHRVTRGLARDEGVGLGLAIARMAVEFNGGQIVVSSIEGSGSRFTLRFPPHQPPARPRPRQS
jgi:heavy metal sensor kinase